MKISVCGSPGILNERFVVAFLVSGGKIRCVLSAKTNIDSPGLLKPAAKLDFLYCQMAKFVFLKCQLHTDSVFIVVTHAFENHTSYGEGLVGK